MKYFKETKIGEVYAYSKEDLKEVASLTKDTPQVFHDIAEKLKDMVELKGAELEEYLNPVPTTEQLASSARYERDKALKALDEVVSNPFRFIELLEEHRLEAATYRKLLLDVPQQKSFPTAYTFPKSPEWLNL